MPIFAGFEIFRFSRELFESANFQYRADEHSMSSSATEPPAKRAAILTEPLHRPRFNVWET